VSRQLDPGIGPAEALARALVGIDPLDEAAMAETAARLDRLTKPPGSLGRLEDLAIRLAGITGRPDAKVGRRAIVVAAADHGVARRGVSAYPAEVTAQMVANFVAGGAAINVLAAAVGASVTVVDAGVAWPIRSKPSAASGDASGSHANAAPGRPPGGHLIAVPIRPGTADMTEGPAMSREEAVRAIAVGLELVGNLARDGVELIGVGEMGIGNTTAASALTAVLSGEPVGLVTGRGTGVDDDGRARKIAAIELALAVNAPDPEDPVGVLAAVGGLEIGVLVGVIAGAAAARIPLLLDGFITGAAALIAVALKPAIAARLIAGHRSMEPGHAVILERLGLVPLLELDLRLGEGSGAALAMHLVGAAAAIRDGMATFESAAVAGPT
jgi:nicotinate-nucleotide--dimethylbenzimidazole phosphoribosyltransferase